MEDDVAKLTVARLVHDAVVLCDPQGEDPAARGLLLAHEDDDRAAAGPTETLRADLRSSVEGIDPDHDSAVAEVAAAVAVFLAGQPEGGSDREATLRVAAHTEWGDRPPENVAAWLAAQGVEV